LDGKSISEALGVIPVWQVSHDKRERDRKWEAFAEAETRQW